MSNVRLKVLVADDEYWICESLKTMLNWDEYSFSFLEPAYDGENALSRIKEDQPDILITDINMPFIRGTELIKMVKALYPDMVVLVLSGYSDFNYVRESLVAGAVDYLLKPISKNNLINVLTKAVDIIGGHRAEQLEKEHTKEKLKIASSVLQDKEMSQFIKGIKDESNQGSFMQKISEYELDFAGFSLVLIKTCNLNRIVKRNHETNANLVCYEIKNKILDCMKEGKSIVFNNIYMSNQFILISDLDDVHLCQICDRVITVLQNYTGFGVSTAISNHYFSFSEIKNAYNESVLAQMARLYNNKSEKINIKDVGGYTVKKRMNTEQENQLIFAVQNKNQALIRKVIFESIMLQNCEADGWLFIEVKQTIDSIVHILTTNFVRNYSPTELMAMDNLSEILDLAFDSCNVSEMCSILEQMIDEFFGSAEPTVTSNSMRETIKKVQKYINENYFEDISLMSLSKLFLVDRSYLSKAFKQETGENLMLYIAEKRISKAKEYFQQNKLNITEISQLVGYDDYGYFNRVFHKITGMSPRDYKSSLAK